MHTLQIAEEVLEDYKGKVEAERYDFLIAQAKEQLEEIRGNEEIYNNYLEQVNVAGEVDDLVLWMLFMSNEDICSNYIREFKKDFFDMMPVNDLADLLFYIIYLKKCENTELDGIVYVLESTDPNMDEVDQASFLNVLSHIARSKEVPMAF